MFVGFLWNKRRSSRTSALPTTRDVARLVKHGGVDALPDGRPAGGRGDLPGNPLPIRAQPGPAACRSSGPSTRTAGCTHGCHYCFARRYQAQLELDADDHFASLIFVKTNFVERLRAELDRPTWLREQVALGTATDPYQPIEGTYRLSRGALECLAQRVDTRRHRHQGPDGGARS